MEINRNEWQTCEGNAIHYTRRKFLKRTSLTVGSILGATTSLSQIAVRKFEPNSNILVVVFLRGGMDGLNAVIPSGDDDYYRQRPSLGIKRNSAIPIGDFFCLHPALGALLPSFENGDLGIVHAVGSLDQSRSHFEAMSAMERGIATARGGESSGWLARYLLATPRDGASPMRAVAIGPVMPDVLRGGLNAIALDSLEDFRLRAESVPEFAALLRDRYSEGSDEVAHAGRETLSVLDALAEIDVRSYSPKNGANYPSGELSYGLQQVSAMVRANIGLEVACLDFGGWDTHVLQGSTEGVFASQLRHVGDSLAAFTTDLKDEMQRISVIVMTEFGRRVYENDGLGTDHGTASVMLALGGGVKGGKVHGDWPSLSPARLKDSGDLEVTTDYRSVLSEYLVSRKGLSDTTAIFPGFSGRQLGLWQT